VERGRHGVLLDGPGGACERLGLGRLDKGRGGVSIRFKCLKGGENEKEGGKEEEGRRKEEIEEIEEIEEMKVGRKREWREGSDEGREERGREQRRDGGRRGERETRGRHKGA